MALNLKPKQWPGGTREVTLGEGRPRALRVGGSKGLPLHTFEAGAGRRPALGLEITDVDPPRWPETLRQAWPGLLGAPAAAAKAAVQDHGAELLMLNLLGTHPDRGDRSPEQAAADVQAVLEATPTPLVVKGPGAGAKQNQVLSRVAESCAGQGLILHSAVQEDYKTLAALAVAYKHLLVAESPIDVNIAKQLNILLSDASLDLDRVLIDPLTGGLGYGLEYTYSVMERIRLAALAGDAPLSCPLICLTGEDVWKAKEVRVSREQEPHFGELEERGVNWEVATGLAVLLAGAEVVIFRHPRALARVREQLDSWFAPGGQS